MYLQKLWSTPLYGAETSRQQFKAAVLNRDASLKCPWARPITLVAASIIALPDGAALDGQYLGFTEQTCLSSSRSFKRRTILKKQRHKSMVCGEIRISQHFGNMKVILSRHDLQVFSSLEALQRLK
jgi:hypothetical protein